MRVSLTCTDEKFARMLSWADEFEIRLKDVTPVEDKIVQAGLFPKILEFENETDMAFFLMKWK